VADGNITQRLKDAANYSYGITVEDAKSLIRFFLEEKAAGCGCTGWDCECGGFAARVLLDLAEERGEI